MENFFQICQEKLSSNSEVHRNGQCIIWTGRCSKIGYGQFRFKDPREPDADQKTRTRAQDGIDGETTEFGCTGKTAS